MFDTGFIDRSPFSALLEAETILPSQFFERFKIEPSTQPEKRLMLAVMEEAIKTFQQCLAGTTSRQRRFLREVEGLPLLRRGKVRDIYEAGEHLLIVATDRVSAFDVVLPNGIPGKGRVLTCLSCFWFEYLQDVVPHHLVSVSVKA